MNLDLATLPSATQRPVGATKSSVRREIINTHFSRRSLLKGMAGLGMAVGIGALGLLPRAKPADAWPPKTWQYCSQWRSSSREAWLRCNPNGSVDGYAGPSFCIPGGKYHRGPAHTRVVDGIRYEYRRRHTSCPSTTGAPGNAWRWMRAEGPNDGPRDVFCSDGRFMAYRAGQLIFKHKSVCRRWDARRFGFFRPRTGF
jgi:hypothetical protein